VAKQALNKIKKKPAASKKKPAAKKKSASKNGLSTKQKVIVLIATWLIVLTPILTVFFMLWSVPEDELPTFTQLENPRSDEASIVYDINGEILGTYYITNRTKVSYQELSPFLVDALVSTEDERFFEHSGVDGWALLRAVGGAATLRNKGGGSTITQQLAKMMFHDVPESKFGRIRQKFGEWIIASKLENRYTKKEIVAMYFNQFDFLNTAVGVHSAARVYFNKIPMDLEIQEAAMLVGMAKNPSIFNPVKDSVATLKRREVVLSQMLKNDKLTQAQYDSVRVLPIGLDYHPETHTTGLAPYFREKVKQEAMSILKDLELKNSFGEDYNLFKGGLKVYTTLDADMQKHAEFAVQEHLSKTLQQQLDDNIEKNKNYPFSNNVSSKNAKKYLHAAMKASDRYKKLKELGWTDVKIEENFNEVTTLEIFDWNAKNHTKKVEMTPLDSIKYHYKVLRAGLVSIDPKTGFIKAYVGGPDYSYFKYDYASTAQRQVGSTIKPFVYAAGIEAGVIKACDEIPYIEYCVEGSDGKQWCPAGDGFDGTMTPIYFGLANSSNPVTAYVISKTGGNNSRVVKYLKNMGMKNNSVKEYPSLGLGVCDQTVLDMTAAHCVFTSKGKYHKPISILRIEDGGGKVLYESHIQTKDIMGAETAFEVLKMMKGVTGVKRPADGKWGGTAGRLRSSKYPYQFKGTMAGKTGTTQDNTDGWFIGHTPDLVTGVWVGCDHRGVHFRSTKYGQGANTGLPIWGYYMKRVYNDKSIKVSHGDFKPVHPGEPTVIECVVDSNQVIDPWDLF
jgi:penicillin-binding protein 1A